MLSSDYVNERVNGFNKTIGAPKSAYDVAMRTLHLSRQSGRSTVLCDTVTEGAAVVVHSLHSKETLVERIKNKRPSFDISSLRFIFYRDDTLDKLIANLQNNNLELKNVYIDNAVWDIIFTAQVKKFYQDHNQALERDNTCGYNCSFLPIDDPKGL